MRREFGGTTLVADFAALDDVDAICELGSEAEILLSQEHGNPSLLKSPQPLKQRLHNERRETLGRLV